MQTESILLEIVTPSGVALRERVAELTAPSVAGEFGALPGHLHMLAALTTGVVTYTQSGAAERVAVHQGFVEVDEDHAILLTERFARPADVDPVAVRLRLKEVGERLAAWEGDLGTAERRELIEEEQWLAVQLELIGAELHPTVREDTRYFAENAAPVEPSPEGSADDAPPTTSVEA